MTTNRKIAQKVNMRGLNMGIGNTYSMFHNALAELIDNSIMAGATNVLVKISLNKKEDIVTIIDNGKGIDASEKGIDTLMKIGDRKKMSEKDGFLNEHGFGHKGACNAIGQTKLLFAKQKNKDTSIVLKSLHFDKDECEIPFKILDKNETVDFIKNEVCSDFENGVYHILSSTRIDGKKGLSLFKEDKKEQEEEIKFFVFEMEKIYRLSLRSGININFEFEHKDKLLSINSLKYKDLPGSEFITAVKSLNGIKVKLTLQVMRANEVQGTCFETRNSKEERKFFYMHDKLLFVPDAADINFGNSMKDAAYSELKLFIEVIKGDFATLANKAGVHNNVALQSLSAAIKSFFASNVRGVIKNEFKEFSKTPSTQDYFKLIRNNELDKYKEMLKADGKLKSIHEVAQQKEFELLQKIQDNLGRDKFEAMKEVSTPTGRRFDLLSFDHISKRIIITEIKSERFNLANEGQVSTYVKYAEKIYLSDVKFKDYKICLHIIAPSIDKKVKESLEFIYKNNLKMTLQDF